MKRFHVHLNVVDLDASIRFYSALFASTPSVTKPDYAKWMLDDPRVNFAISTTGRAAGVDHLGIQAETADELADLGARLDRAGATLVPEADTTCCYARSDKLWTTDPQATRWETFHTTGTATTYYAPDGACETDGMACARAAAAPPVVVADAAAKAACCAPASRCC